MAPARPGSVPIEFKTRQYNGTVERSPIGTDSFIAYNTGMSAAKLVGTPEGTTFNLKEATSLFPFTSPDSFYAGACTANNPESGAALATATVPAGGAAATKVVQLPTLYLTVKSGPVAVNGAQVAVTDQECKWQGHNIRRVRATNSAGQLSDPGFPYSTYTVCASVPITVLGSTTRYKEVKEGVEVPSVTGTTLELNVTSSDPVGEC